MLSPNTILPLPPPLIGSLKALGPLFGARIKKAYGAGSDGLTIGAEVVDVDTELTDVEAVVDVGGAETTIEAEAGAETDVEAEAGAETDVEAGAGAETDVEAEVGAETDVEAETKVEVEVVGKKCESLCRTKSTALKSD